MLLSSTTLTSTLTLIPWYPLGPFWTPRTLLDSFWTPLEPFGPHWTPLDPFESFWTLLDPFGRTLLDPFGPFWNLLDTFGPFVTLLEPFGRFGTFGPLGPLRTPQNLLRTPFYSTSYVGKHLSLRGGIDFEGPWRDLGGEPKESPSLRGGIRTFHQF